MYINSTIFKFRGFADAPRVSSILGKPEEEINHLVRMSSGKRKNLLSILSDRYNTQNFYKPKEEQESPDLVVNIFNMIKRPGEKQFEIISGVHGTLENVKNIFEQTGSNPKLLAFAIRVNELVGSKGRPELITEILKSPFRKEYMKNFSN